MRQAHVTLIIITLWWLQQPLEYPGGALAMGHLKIHSYCINSPVSQVLVIHDVHVLLHSDIIDLGSFWFWTFWLISGRHAQSVIHLQCSSLVSEALCNCRSVSIHLLDMAMSEDREKEWMVRSSHPSDWVRVLHRYEKTHHLVNELLKQKNIYIYIR